MYLKLIERAVRRGAEISHRVSDYLKTGTASSTSVNLKAVLEDCLELTRPLWSKSPMMKVTWDIGETPVVCGNASDLRRVFTNLIINAIEAMPNGGSLHIRTTQKHGAAQVYISDTGQGIKPEHRKRIFSQLVIPKAISRPAAQARCGNFAPERRARNKFHIGDRRRVGAG
jgi:signal transduction histidine kinase